MLLTLTLFTLLFLLLTLLADSFRLMSFSRLFTLVIEVVGWYKGCQVVLLAVLLEFIGQFLFFLFVQESRLAF